VNLSFKATQENLIDSITDTGSVVFTNEKNLYVVKSDGSKLKITDTIFLESVDDLELIPMEQRFLNKIYITKDNWKMYSWDGEDFVLLSGGGGGGSGNIETIRETIPVVDGQTIIKLPFTYSMGGSLKVYKNGHLLDINLEYREIDQMHIELFEPAFVNDIFTFMIETGGYLTVEPIACNIDIEYYPDGSIYREIYTGGIEKIITYFYNDRGLMVKRLVERNGIVVEANFEYNEYDDLVKVDDEGTEIAVITDDGINRGVKPFEYRLRITYNDIGKLDTETFTGDITRTVKYEYNERGDITLKTVTDGRKGDIVTTKQYIYDAEGHLTDIIDGGTDIITVEGNLPASIYDTIVLKKQMAEMIALTASLPQENVQPQLEGSTNLKDDIATLTSIINDLITFNEQTRMSVDIGDGIATDFIITHDMETFDVTVQVMDNLTHTNAEVEISRPDLNNVKISFLVPPQLNEYRVLIRA
jgi:hypothetical protein